MPFMNENAIVEPTLSLLAYKTCTNYQLWLSHKIEHSSNEVKAENQIPSNSISNKIERIFFFISVWNASINPAIPNQSRSRSKWSKFTKDRTNAALKTRVVRLLNSKMDEDQHENILHLNHQIWILIEPIQLSCNKKCGFISLIDSSYTSHLKLYWLW